jgi:iron complex outermembrane receptor protein
MFDSHDKSARLLAGRCQRLLKSGAIAALGLTIMAPPCADAQSITTETAASGNQPASTETQIEEILVTAQRRSTSILKTPVSVSSVSGPTMQDRGLQNLSDLTTEVPGVQFGTQYTNTNVTIRGIGASGTNTQGGDPGVAFNLDGVYIEHTGLAGSNLLDVNHVEIARGPQGTLFGRNATGGAVNVISNLPTRDFEADLGGWVGVDPTQVHADGFVSGPLTSDGVVLGRFSVRRDYNKGFTTNLSPDGPHNLDDQDGYAMRAQVEVIPNDYFTANLAIDYDSAKDNGTGIFLTGAPGVTPSGGYYTISPAAVTAEDAALLGVTGGVPGNINIRQAADNEAAFNSTFFGARGTLEWRGNYGTLRVLAAFDRDNMNDNESGDGETLNFANIEVLHRDHQYYAEVLYSSKTFQNADFQVGANAFNEVSDETFVVPVQFLHLSDVLTSELNTHSYAAFAHGNYHLTSRAKLFAGARYTIDKKGFNDENSLANGGVPLYQSKSWNSFTYEVGGSYELSDAVNAYAKYSTGFKAGGFSAGSLAPPFQPEKDGSVEVGLKGLYFDRRLEADLDVFHMDYTDLQVNQVIGVSSVTDNAAKAKIDGAEFSFVALPVRGLRAELTGSYLDARFTQFLTGDGARPTLGTLNLAGNKLPNSPRFSYSAGLYYDLPIDVPGTITLGGRYYWKDKIYFSQYNVAVASQAAVGRGDINLSYVSADKKWQAGFFVRNITDAKVLNDVLVISAILNSAALGRLDSGREIGISLRRHF